MSQLNVTKISWTDYTWNTVSGCRKVSPGCQFCYAHTIAENKRGTKAFPHGFDLTYRWHRLEEPLKLKTPSRIFVNSMSDMFFEQIPDDDILRVFDVMNRCHEQKKGHIFQILTKRSKRMLDLSPRLQFTPNVWLGVSVENSKWTHRLDHLVEVPATVRFVSAEPLLGPLGDLSFWLPNLHWMIVGGESGIHLGNAKKPKNLHRWMDHGWAREIRDQCIEYDVPFFFKQSSGGRSETGTLLCEEDGSFTQWRQMPKVRS
jgi:protein gp37